MVSEIISLIKESPTIGFFLIVCILVLPRADRLVKNVFVFLAFLLLLCIVIMKRSLDTLGEVIFFDLKFVFKGSKDKEQRTNKPQVSKESNLFYQIKTLMKK